MQFQSTTEESFRTLQLEYKKTTLKSYKRKRNINANSLNSSIVWFCSFWGSLTIFETSALSKRHQFFKHYSRKVYFSGNIEITRMSQMKTEIIPVIVGELEVIKTGSEKLVSEIRWNINFWEIQKTALLRIIIIIIMIIIIK